MAEILRTFIAVKVAPQPPLSQLITKLKKIFEDEKIRWVDENNLHLTLKFLGDITPIQVEQVKSVIQKTAENFSVFSFDLVGIGFFKRNRHPNVLFVKIERNEFFKQLAAETDSVLSEIGFEKEQREFNPHLTLARIKYLKNKPQFYEVIEKFENSSIQQVKVNEVVFYQSILKPQGAEYIPLAKIRLNSF